MYIFIFLLKYKIGLILNVKNKLLNIKKKNIIAFKIFACDYSYDQDPRVLIESEWQQKEQNLLSIIIN